MINASQSHGAKYTSGIVSARASRRALTALMVLVKVKRLRSATLNTINNSKGRKNFIYDEYMALPT